MSVIPVVAGAIINSSGYLIVEVSYMALLFVTLMSAIVLCILHSVSVNKLDLSAKARRKAEKDEKEEEMEEKVTTIPTYKIPFCLMRFFWGSCKLPTFRNMMQN